MRRRTEGQNKTPAQKMAKNMSIFAFVTCLIVIGILMVFYQSKNNNLAALEDNEPKTESGKIAAKDLEVDYPATPTEVVKLLGRINKCLYNSELAEEEQEKLLEQLRALYSQKLLEQNPPEEHKQNLVKELDEFSSKTYRIVNYTVDKSSSVKYETVEGQECAYLQVAYFVKNRKESKSATSVQDYVLVKEDSKWKILAFKSNPEANKQGKKSDS